MSGKANTTKNTFSGKGQLTSGKKVKPTNTTVKSGVVSAIKWSPKGGKTKVKGNLKVTKSGK